MYTEILAVHTRCAFRQYSCDKSISGKRKVGETVAAICFVQIVERKWEIEEQEIRDVD